jgi:proton-dependent oligopeptide transporter, POT family
VSAAVPPAVIPRAGDWLGYPKGAWLIIGVEFWERFSFYGMLSILVLFLTATPAHGGFGWSATEALTLLGVYSFSMYAFPALGGFFADRVLGRRRAVKVGATFMLIGQVMLASPVFLPQLLGYWHGAPLLQSLHALGEPLGRLRHSGTLDAAILQQGALLDHAAGAGWLMQAYVAASVGFFVALFCLVLGNALMKSTLVVLCGETMSTGDPRREAAYAYYYLGISVGAMLSGVFVGWVAEHLGWHFGFALAAAGMAVALGSYLLLAQRWLGDIGVRPDVPTPPRSPNRDIATSASASASARGDRARSEALPRIALLAVLAGLLCAFSVGWFQLFGSWLLFIERDVNRAIGSFVIPVPWFTSMNAAVVIVLAPLVAALWVRLETRNQRVDIVQKYAFALSMVVGGHVLMYLAARHATPTAPAPVWIPITSLSMLAIGELVAWTATYGMVSRAAPAGFASVAMGAWYLLTLGLGGYLSAFTGPLIDSAGFAAAFGTVAVIMGVAFIIAVLLRAPLSRLAQRAGVAL